MGFSIPSIAENDFGACFLVFHDGLRDQLQGLIAKHAVQAPALNASIHDAMATRKDLRFHI